MIEEKIYTTNIIHKKRLLDYSTHKYYVNNYKRTRPKELHAKSRKEFLDILSTFYQIIGEQLLEREGGVCIKELGYFFIWEIPRKMNYDLLNKDGYTSKFNYATDHKMYSPILIPAKRIKYWYLDKAFTAPIKKGLRDKLRAGKRYKMYAHTLKQLKKYH